MSIKNPKNLEKMKEKSSLNLKNFLSVLTVVLTEEMTSNAEKLKSFQVKENLKILVKYVAKTQAKEGLYYMIKEPNSRAAKALLIYELKKVVADDVYLKNLSLSVLKNSDSLNDVKSIVFMNLNFLDNDNIIQIGNNNIAIGDCRSLNIHIENDNIDLELN